MSIRGADWIGWIYLEWYDTTWAALHSRNWACCFTFLAGKAFLVHFTSFLPTGTFLALLFLLGKQHFKWDELSRLQRFSSGGIGLARPVGVYLYFASLLAGQHFYFTHTKYQKAGSRMVSNLNWYSLQIVRDLWFKLFSSVIIGREKAEIWLIILFTYLISYIWITEDTRRC